MAAKRKGRSVGSAGAPLIAAHVRKSEGVDSPDILRWGSRIAGRSDETAVVQALAAARARAGEMAHGPCPHVTFLIDECVTPLLEQVALDFGYHAYFIHHRGWSGLKDSQLYQKLIEHDLTLVTNNRSDWLALLGKTALHPGLVVIQENAPRDKELAWFARCLVTMTAQHSMVNTVVEVAADGAVSVYALPAP